MKNDSDIKGAIRFSGLRVTKIRARVLGFLRRIHKPISHAEIMLALKSADKVTVYRTLAALADAGLVHRTFTGERTALYESADRCEKHSCHPHFTCRECGMTKCLTSAHVPLVKTAGKGFKLERQRVHIEGVCPSCNRRSAG
jgi:Fe2+ or Zn2+ uptake regulation protein